MVNGEKGLGMLLLEVGFCSCFLEPASPQGGRRNLAQGDRREPWVMALQPHLYIPAPGRGDGKNMGNHEAELL